MLRRPPFGHKAKSAHDMLREARVMAALKPAYPEVPEVLAPCDDPAVLGCDFYVMERIAGIIARQDLPAGLGLGEAETRRLCLGVIDRLVELHAVDPTRPASRAWARARAMSSARWRAGAGAFATRAPTTSPTSSR